MTHPCDQAASLLGQGRELPEALGEHVANCLSCQELAAVYEDLDALLLSEPVPMAPRSFAQAVMAAVAALDPRAELRLARRQALVALAAAVILAVVATWGLPAASESTLWVPDHEAALAQTQGMVDGISIDIEQAVDVGLAALPSPPLMLLWLIAPALLAGNWLLSRQRLPHGVTS